MRDRIKGKYDIPEKVKKMTIEEKEEYLRKILPPVMQKRIRVVDWYWVVEISMDWVNREAKK